jgi:hypothetical protein
VSGYRYTLALEDGEPADPAVFVTAVPDCHVGDTFVAPNGQLFRILAIEPEMDEERSAETMGLLVVEPVGEAMFAGATSLLEQVLRAGILGAEPYSTCSAGVAARWPSSSLPSPGRIAS